MPDGIKCELCTEKCPQAVRAHEAAVGRMYATKEFIEMQKKVESGQLVEVVRCKDCRFRLKGKNLCTHTKNIIFNTGLQVSSEHFCSYGELRKEAAQDEKSDRERLMQLLQEARTKHLMKEVVDYLIANGVTFDRKA